MKEPIFKYPKKESIKMDKQIRYSFDKVNSNNKDNLVKGEFHTLDDRRFKCMTLFHGSFYAQSVRVFQPSTGYELKHNVDYVYSDIDAENSTITGEPIANVIIVVNQSLGRDFSVNYYAAGLPLKDVHRRTVALLEAPEDPNFSNYYLDVKKRPVDFKPTFHYHALSDIEKFEKILFHLEGIRIGVVYENSTPIREYLVKIETILQGLTEKAIKLFNTEIEVNFKKFRDAFTKENFQVDNIRNLELLPPEATFRIATGEDKNSKPDGLLAWKAFMGFKNGIYDTYLTNTDTLIGYNKGMIIPPTLEYYFYMLNGTTTIIDTYSNNMNKTESFDRLAYPHLKRTNSRFNIRKIVNSSATKCIVVATEMEACKVFIGKITKSNIGYLCNWSEVVEPTALRRSILEVSEHLAHHGNPHSDTKSHVELGLMENFPVANILDILLHSKEKKYITWFLLDKYIKKFVVKQRPNKTSQLEDKDENLMRNVSVVFSACGTDCNEQACKVIESIPPTTTTTTTTPAPASPVNIGFYIENYTDAQELLHKEETNLSNYSGSLSFDYIVDKYPQFYNTDATDLVDPPEQPNWSVGGQWKNFNIFSNRFFADIGTPARENDGIIYDHEHYNRWFSGDGYDNFIFTYFRLLRRDALPEVPFYFRVAFEVLETFNPLGKVVEQLQEYEFDPVEVIKCKDFDNGSHGASTPASSPNSNLDEEEGGVNRLFTNKAVSLDGHQMFVDGPNYTSTPTDIGVVFLRPKALWNLYIDESNNDAVEDMGQVDGRSRKMRLHVIQIDAPENTDGEVNDIGPVITVDFTLACYNLESNEYWRDGGVYGRKHSIYSILNIRPTQFIEQVQHPLCLDSGPNP